MKYLVAQETRIGARRINQDRIGCWATPDCALLAVADGLGGHMHGELAAELAIRLLGVAFEREAQPRLPDPDEFLVRTIGAAHAAIVREAERRGYSDTPRTVIVSCVVQDGHAYWRHVGDSRLYHIRQGRILQRTRDHTVVQQLVEEGRILEEAITSHPDRNRLLQCLGGYQAPHPDAAAKVRLAKDDILLLCSDGFWSPLTQRQMMHALAAHALDIAIPQLVELAERRAGPQCDNISVLAMTWGEEEIAATVADVERTEVRDLTATDLDYLRMSDEDVEKAIAELKAALRKGQVP